MEERHRIVPTHGIRLHLTYIGSRYMIIFMKPISLRIEEGMYRDLKFLAERTGRPVAELIREAMSEYLSREAGDGKSILDLTPHSSGVRLRGWTREELLDEMRGR